MTETMLEKVSLKLKTVSLCARCGHVHGVETSCEAAKQERESNRHAWRAMIDAILLANQF